MEAQYCLLNWLNYSARSDHLDREESSAGLQGRSFRSYLQYNTTPNGDRSCCDNYHRSITVLSLAGKALARVLLNRLYDHLLASDHLESQCGFRAGRGKIDMIFTTTPPPLQRQENCREQHLNLYKYYDLHRSNKSIWLHRQGWCTVAYHAQDRLPHQLCQHRTLLSWWNVYSMHEMSKVPVFICC